MFEQGYEVCLSDSLVQVGLLRVVKYGIVAACEVRLRERIALSDSLPAKSRRERNQQL